MMTATASSLSLSVRTFQLAGSHPPTGRCWRSPCCKRNQPSLKTHEKEKDDFNFELMPKPTMNGGAVS